MPDDKGLQALLVSGHDRDVVRPADQTLDHQFCRPATPRSRLSMPAAARELQALSLTAAALR